MSSFLGQWDCKNDLDADETVWRRYLFRLVGVLLQRALADKFCAGSCLAVMDDWKFKLCLHCCGKSSCFCTHTCLSVVHKGTV